MTLATKIVVVKGGIIRQIGSPAEIYYRPANLFVVSLMGSPAMNAIPAKTRKNGKCTHIEIGRKGSDSIVLIGSKNQNLPENVIIGAQPEDIVEPAGAHSFAVVQLGGKSVTARLHPKTNA